MSRLLRVVNDSNNWMVGDRFTANTYSQINQHKTANPKLKVERGWFLNEERVTFSFSRDPTKTRPPTAGNRFEIKIGGVKKQVSSLVSRAYDDFIQKQAECINAYYDTKLIAQLEDLVSVRDAHQQHYNKQRAKLENLKKFGGSEEDIKKTKKEVKQQSEALESTKDSILDRVEKMRTMYINFIGDLHGTFTDTVETTLLKPITHEVTSYELKKVAFQWDNTKDEPVGRIEMYDDRVDDVTFNDPDVKFRYEMQEVTHEIDAPRGLSFEGIMNAIRSHAVHQGGYGRAEIQKKKMTNHALFPPNGEIPVKDFVGFLEDINRNIPLLPSIKDNPMYINNDQVPWGNKPFTQKELCDILVDCMPKKVQTLFKSHNANNTVRFDVKLLANELQPLVDQVRTEQKASQPQGGGGGGGGAGKNSSNRNNQRGNRKNGQGNQNQADSETKHCKLCKKFGGAHHNHNTADCQKYNEDGSLKRQRGRDNYSNKEVVDMLASMKAENKKLRKSVHALQKGSAKKKKRSMSYSEEEEDSDSE